MQKYDEGMHRNFANVYKQTEGSYNNGPGWQTCTNYGVAAYGYNEPKVLPPPGPHPKMNPNLTVTVNVPWGKPAPLFQAWQDPDNLYSFFNLNITYAPQAGVSYVQSGPPNYLGPQPSCGEQ